MKSKLYLLVISLLFVSCQNNHQAVNDRLSHPLVGRWIRVEKGDEEGNKIKVPEIAYDFFFSDGTMMVQHINPDYPKLTAPPSTIEEYKAIFRNFYAAFGKYSIDAKNTGRVSKTASCFQRGTECFQIG